MSLSREEAAPSPCPRNRGGAPHHGDAARRVTLLTGCHALAQRVSSEMRTADVDVVRADTSSSPSTVARIGGSALIVLHWEQLTFAAIEGCTALKADPLLARLPVVVFSDWTSPVAERIALDAGADGYWATSCSDRDMVRLIADQLDRAPVSSSGRFLFYADLALDLSAWRVHCAGSSAGLTIAAYDLLCTLMRRPDRPLSRKHLVDGMSASLPRRREDRVNVHVRELRCVLKKIGSRVVVRAEGGVGYSLISRIRQDDNVTKR